MRVIHWFKSSVTLDEQVILPTHEAVNMTVSVAATRLRAGAAYRPQPYSLVITGRLRPK
jgi:hypothetical protein